ILLSNSDSALLFFDKAYNAITEREIKKHDEYYEEMYSRRDPRTAEFGVTFSDVRLDLETRIKNIKDRKEKAKELKMHFVESERLYLLTAEQFKLIQSKFTLQSSFFLRSDEALVQRLTKLAQTYDSVLAAFGNYRATLKSIHKPNYNQQLNPQEIIDFRKDGTSLADFFTDDLRIWDYKRWAKLSLETIENVINPLRERLIAYDISLNKLDLKLKRDSVSIVSDLDHLEDGLLYEQLSKYDPTPLPLSIFEMKKADLRYKSSVVAHKPFKDTSNIMLRLSFLKEELKYVSRLDSLAKKLLERDIAVESENYQHFVAKSYGNQMVLSSLVKTTHDFANREKLKKELDWENTMQATKWVLNDTDSIPLFFEQSKDLKFKPLVIWENKYTIGLQYNDSTVTGYLYSITPSRRPDVKATFEVNKARFTKRNLPILKCISTTDALQQVYFSLIYLESKVEERFLGTVTKVDRSDGLAWSVNLKLDFMPTELIYNAETSELSIKISTLGENKVITIDKNGKQIQ
ncbi:MAG: hypothetical protein ORN54_03130, partial [Cyclobacteriaceae bacterium]|nr:hypothetical protein [Cyclobacteriaceae bacterium]